MTFKSKKMYIIIKTAITLDFTQQYGDCRDLGQNTSHNIDSFILLISKFGVSPKKVGLSTPLTSKNVS